MKKTIYKDGTTYDDEGNYLGITHKGKLYPTHAQAVKESRQAFITFTIAIVVIGLVIYLIF